MLPKSRSARGARASALGLALLLGVGCGGSGGGGARDGGGSLDGGSRGDAGPGPADGGRVDGGSIAPADGGGDPPVSAVPRAVRVARATELPACTDFVDSASAGAADGTAERPYRTIAAAVAAAASGAVICVAEGTYAEALAPGERYFTLAGGFASGRGFTVRDSSLYVTRGQGDGTDSFLRIEDPGPTEGQLTAVDGFELTGYSQAIVRDVYYPQRFDLTNCYIHDNACAADGLAGAGFFLKNVSGTISGNVIARNRCWRGGGGALDDSVDGSDVSLVGNLVDSNVGDEPGISHGGGLYLFAHALTLTGNELTGNGVTGWGGGLYVGAFTGGGQETTAHLSWNVYRDNRAGDTGGGFFCDDSARCLSDHELYVANCGGNIYLDSGPDGAGPTIATFDHLTSVRGLAVGCDAPGASVAITKNNTAADSYAFTNAIFWESAPGRDFDASCGSGCDAVTVTVAFSDVQTTYANGGVAVAFGEGLLPGVDPLFVDAAGGDYHLRSTHGHWAPGGYVVDSTDSPALAAGDPAGATGGGPERAGDRSELGVYGDSPEASYVR